MGRRTEWTRVSKGIAIGQPYLSRGKSPHRTAWVVRVKHPNHYDGVMRMYNQGTDGPGLEKARRVAKQLASVLETGAVKGTPTVGEVLSAWHQERAPMMKPGSRKSSASLMKRHLIPLLGERAVTDLSTPVLWDFVVELVDRQGRNPGVACNALIYLRRAMGLLWEGELSKIEWETPGGRAGQPPAKRISATISRTKNHYAHLIREREAFTPDEAVIVLDVAREHLPEFYPFLWLALATGMRSGELRALQWSDVDLERGTLRLTHGMSDEERTSTKTGIKGKRMVLIPPRCLEMLRRMGRHSPYVFAPGGHHWRRCDVPRAMVKVMEIAVPRGVRAGLTFHSCRHAFVSQARMRQIPDVWLEQQVWGRQGIRGGYTHTDLANRPDMNWADYGQATVSSPVDSVRRLQ